MKIPSHEPIMKQGDNGLIIYHFQGTQSSAKDTPNRVVQREYISSFG